MATNNAELAPSVDRSSQNPTPWMNELWGDSQTSQAYGKASSSTSTAETWKDYLNSGKGKADVQFVSTSDASESTERPGQNSDKIQFTNRLYDSFVKAMAEKKPLVVELSQPSCVWCQKLNKETFNSPEMTAFKDKAVFVRIDPLKDEDDHGNVMQLLKDLKIVDDEHPIDQVRFPQTIVLDISKGGMSELGRIVGYFDGKDFADHLKKMLPENASSSSATPQLAGGYDDRQPPKV